MPKSLRIHANERIDLEDFELAATGYTRETAKIIAERSLLDRYPEVLESFRIEIADQAVSPGQITVYNGSGFSRNGQLVHIEGQPEASLTVTLTGANQTFYVEIEFTETASDVDSRGFWDPTVDNADPIPDGAESSVSVATCNTPSWTIVTPVSTTAFDITNNPNSNRIPLAIFNTDASNRIDASVNGFTSLVTASTVLESDVALGSSVVKVIDSRLFPVGSIVTVDFGGTSPQTGLTVTINDYTNNILTLSASLATAHLAGAIVKREAGTGIPVFLQENADPNDPAFALTSQDQPNDRQPRMWQGDEVHGSALISSKYTAGARDDLNLRSLADYVDSVAANIREMKFGHPRADVVSTAPPSTFSTRPRHFDRAGSITGARTNTLSIGNGTTTFGDFNGATDAVFTAAIAALPTGGGTIFVKAGTYTFANTVSLPAGKTVDFIGEGETTVVITANAPLVGAFQIPGTAYVSFENVQLNGTATYSIIDSGTDITCGVSLYNSSINGLRCNTGTTSTVEVYWSNATITGSILVDRITGKVNNCTFTECTITGTPINLTVADSDVANNNNSFLVSSNASGLIFRGCLFTGTISNSAHTKVKLTDGSGVVFDSCRSTVSGNFAPVGYNFLFLDASGVDNIYLNNCQFSFSNTQAGTDTNLTMHTRLLGTDISQNVFIDGCIWDGDFSTHGSGCVDISNGYGSAQIANCQFKSYHGVIVTDHVGPINIANCMFDWNGSSSTPQGVFIYAANSSNQLRLAVSSCLFNGYGAGNSVSLVKRRAIDVTCTHVDTNISIANCSFVSIGNIFADETYSVVIVVGGGDIAIKGNKFSGGRGDYGAHVVYVGATTGVSTANISNNSFYECSLVTGNVITVQGVAGSTVASISGNSMTSCVSSSGIYVNNCQANISGNTFNACSGSGSSAHQGINILGTSAGSLISSNSISSETSTGEMAAVKLASSGVSVVGNVIQNVWSTGADTHGVWVSGANNDILISNNTIKNLDGNNTIYFIRASNGSASNIAIIGNELIDSLNVYTPTEINGIRLFSNDNCKINNNIINSFINTDANIYGIFSEACGSTDISNNSISSISGASVRALSAHGSTDNLSINSNNIAIIRAGGGLTSYGIYVDVDNVTVSSNLIYQVDNHTGATKHGVGIYVINSSNITVNANNIESASYYGVYTYNCDYISILGNTVTGAGNGILAETVSVMDQVIVNDNQVSLFCPNDTIYLGIRIYGSINKITGTVNGNNIKVGNDQTAAQAIVIYSTTGSMSVTGNVCMGYPGSTAGLATAVAITLTAGTVANNVCKDWRSGSSTMYLQLTRGSAMGNIMEASTTPTNGYEVVITTGNFIGNLGTNAANSVTCPNIQYNNLT